MYAIAKKVTRPPRTSAAIVEPRSEILKKRSTAPLGAVDVAASGGYETYQSGTKAVLTSPTRHDFDDLGESAYVDIGTIAGGENLQVAGGVLVGEVIYTLNLSQAAGLSEEELVAVSEKLLQLMVDAG